MMVTSTAAAELEALRATLHAEVTRIRTEFEIRLPDLEGDLAAVDRLLRHRASPSSSEPFIDAADEAPTAEPIRQEPHVAAQDVLGDAPISAGSPELTSSAPAVSMAVASEPQAPARTQRGTNWKRALAGLRQGEAVVRIAERMGGGVTVGQVAQILLNAGLTRARGRFGHSQASHVLSESKHFERVGRGTYRLRSRAGCDEPSKGDQPS
jgi:hypothetical protein